MLQILQIQTRVKKSKEEKQGNKIWADWGCYKNKKEGSCKNPNPNPNDLTCAWTKATAEGVYPS